MTESKYFTLNLGPQHPAAHGVLRLILQLNGEQIEKCDPHIGLLHRGTEKLIEQKTQLQSLPYVDRLDYVSMFCNEHVFSQVLEKNLLMSTSVRTQYIRVFLLEITRILNHLMCLTTHAMDVGALTPFLWGFEEREKLMEIYERLSGARMHAAFIRPGGISKDLPMNILKDIYIFCKFFAARIDELDQILSKNRIFKKRLANIAVVNKKKILSWALTGPLARSVGLPIDLRVNTPYEVYALVPFKSVLSQNGDSYSRYFIRLEEMRESLKIIEWILNRLPSGQIKGIGKNSISKLKTKQLKQTMEDLICHFKQILETAILNKGEFFSKVEAPKGVLGVFIKVNVNLTKLIYRCKFRTPGFFHLQALNQMSINHSLSDAVAIIGTQDIVFGEVDR